MKKIIALSLAVALAGCASNSHYIYGSDIPANTINNKPNFNVPTYVCENNLRLDFDSTKKGTSEIRFEDFFGYSADLTQDANNPNHYYNNDKNIEVFKDKRNIVLSRDNNLVTCSQYIPNEEEEKALVKNTKKIALASGVPAKVINISRVIYLYSYPQQIAEARKNAELIIAKEGNRSSRVAPKSSSKSVKVKASSSVRTNGTKAVSTPAQRKSIFTTPVNNKAKSAPMYHKATSSAPVYHKATTTAPVYHKSTTVAPVNSKATTAPVYHKSTTVAPVYHKSTTVAPVNSKTTTTPVYHKSTTVSSVYHKDTSSAPVYHKNTPTVNVNTNTNANKVTPKAYEVQQITPIAKNIVNNANTGVNNFNNNLSNSSEKVKDTVNNARKNVNGVVYSLKDQATNSSSSTLSTIKGYLGKAQTAYTSLQTAKLKHDTTAQTTALGQLKTLSDKASALSANVKDAKQSSFITPIVNQIKGLYNKAVGK